jgi:hypothetical protein
MPIAYVGSASVLNSTSGFTTAVPMPAGIAAGNLLLAAVANVGTSPTTSAPSGWSLVASYSPGTTLTTYLYRKVATGSETTTTWTWSSQGRNLGVCVAYSGVDTTLSSTAATAWAHDDGGGPVAAPSLGAQSGDWLVTFGVGRESPGTSTTKNWSISAVTDAERLDVSTAGAATDVKVTAAWYDSAAGLASGATARTLSSTPELQQRHLWSVLLPLPAAERAGGNPWTHMGLPLR